ncbi:MAG TPA: SDR family NAD(P)-dependent oxidoreductase [Isosphaeraceae bacterium]
MPAPSTALITGASAGLGRELVRQLVRDRGMTVYATARRLDRLGELRSELPEGEVHVLAGDIASAQFRASLWDWAERESGGIDLLVNNAGVGHYADFAEQDPAEVRRIVEVNVMAVFDLTQRAIRAMRARRRGEIVEVSSVLGTFGIPYSAAYVASKHAVDGLVKSVRHELRGSGVSLWALRPGRFASEFRQASLGGRGTDHAKPGGPVEAIARSLVRNLGTRKAFVTPTLGATLTVAVPHWLPAQFEAFMRWLGPERFAREVGGAIKRSSAP